MPFFVCRFNMSSTCSQYSLIALDMVPPCRKQKTCALQEEKTLIIKNHDVRGRGYVVVREKEGEREREMDLKRD